MCHCETITCHCEGQSPVAIPFLLKPVVMTRGLPRSLNTRVGSLAMTFSLNCFVFILRFFQYLLTPQTRINSGFPNSFALFAQMVHNRKHSQSTACNLSRHKALLIHRLFQNPFRRCCRRRTARPDLHQQNSKHKLSRPLPNFGTDLLFFFK